METGRREYKSLRAIKLAGVFLLLITIGILIGLLLATLARPDTKQILLENSQGKTLQYNLHYPAKIPVGYTVDKDTITIDEETGSFAILHNDGNRLYVTQQKRPLLMEEVNKTREFNTNIGKAYIADLNGRIAGFIVTNDTLIIISSSGEIDVNVLRQLMENMAAV